MAAAVTLRCCCFTELGKDRQGQERHACLLMSFVGPAEIRPGEVPTTIIDLSHTRLEVSSSRPRFEDVPFTLWRLIFRQSLLPFLRLWQSHFLSPTTRLAIIVEEHTTGRPFQTPHASPPFYV